MTSTVAATVCIAVLTFKALDSLSRIASSPRTETASEYPSLSSSLASSNRSLITTSEAKKRHQMMSLQKILVGTAGFEPTAPYYIFFE
jgi:hypothetical protein